MRRDLAVCRERSGTKLPSPPNATSTMMVSAAPSSADSDAMEIDAQQAPTNPVQPETNPAPLLSTKPPAELAKNASPSCTVEDPHPASAAVAADAHPQPLHIDTQRARANPLSTGEDGPDDPPLSTARLSTNADLESLFNDPASAGGGGGGATTASGTTTTPPSVAHFDLDDAFPAHPAPHDVGFDLDGGTTFDAPAEPAGNGGGAAGISNNANPNPNNPNNPNNNNNNDDDDDVATLLPGLQDWANHTQTGEGGGASAPAPVGSAVDSGNFDDLFSGGGVGDTPQQEQEQQQPMSSFDDLMDFDFSYAGESGDGAGGEGERGGGEFDFSFD